jgi:1-aminocyclopropane-1-carboxylate deaminase
MAVPEDHGVAQNVEAIVQGGYELLDASRGGFASVDPLLLAFIEATEQACGLPLEPLYTGKALLALKAQIEAGRFTPGTRVVFVHTGGLQGRRGFAV